MAQQSGNRVISSSPRPALSTGTEQPQILVIANLGRDPTYLTCPFCKMQIVTRIEFKPNSSTHAAAMSGGLCCICMPYYMDDLQTAYHYCTLCGALIGKCV